MLTQTRPTEILAAEHRVIERVLECLDVLAQRAQRDGVLDAESAAQALEVVATFADRCHHMKEEDVLFARMHARGIPDHVGPIAVMLHDHEAGRSRVRAMRWAVTRHVKGEPDAAKDFAENSLAYTELLREHIAKEDHVLYPMAEACFSEQDRLEVLEDFARKESKDMGAGTHERMLALVDGLCARLCVPKPAHTSSSPHKCGLGGCGQH
ncbi:MAG: hemerythrin domain-containing protein [Planctomycetes bacterium]|nr:hemerythrin domain-containing protein [Planctomycetota bacterium]